MSESGTTAQPLSTVLPDPTEAANVEYDPSPERLRELSAHLETTTESRHKLLTTAEAADYLGIKESTLITWRCTQAVKIPYVKFGRNVRYRRSDLENYLEQHTVNAN